MGQWLLCCIAGAVLSCSSALAAECGGAPNPIFPCDGCAIKGSMTTRRDVTCVRGLTLRSAAYVVSGFKTAKQAQHGRVSVTGTGITYSPARGFTGTDSFTIEIDFRRGSTPLPTYLDVTMDVAP